MSKIFVHKNPPDFTTNIDSTYEIFLVKFEHLFKFIILDKF